MPTFPTITWDQLESGQIIQITNDPGISKREYFAAKAMQGLLACDHVGNCGMPGEALAKSALHYADALILELSKPQP